MPCPGRAAWCLILTLVSVWTFWSDNLKTFSLYWVAIDISEITFKSWLHIHLETDYKAGKYKKCKEFAKHVDAMLFYSKLNILKTRSIFICKMKSCNLRGKRTWIVCNQIYIAYNTAIGWCKKAADCNSACALHMCQLLAVGSWITWFISNWDKNDCCWKESSVSVKIAVILWICSAWNGSYFCLILR